MKTIILLVIAAMSFNTYAYMTHEKIVDSFLNQKKQLTPHFDKLENYNREFKIPLEQVISAKQRLKLKEKKLNFITDFSNFPVTVDLRERDTSIKRQIGPRCTSYGLIASIENLLNAPQIVDLSEAHFWYNYAVYSSEAAVATAINLPITEESKWEETWKNGANNYKDFAHTYLTDISYIEDDNYKALQALSEGRPVYLGMSVTKSMGNCDKTLAPESSLTGGGHAIAIVGYGLDDRIPGGGYYMIKNSWGKDCADEGYQYIPFNYCNREQSGQYCVMWDVQGVQTDYAGVQDVIATDIPFDIEQIWTEVSTSKKWWKRKRSYDIRFYADYRVLKKIDYVELQEANGNTRNYTSTLESTYIPFHYTTRARHSDWKATIHLKTGETFAVDVAR